MCGIVGYIGKQNASGVLLEGLKRLEYRGYDSAGLAVLQNKKSPSVRLARKRKDKKGDARIRIVKAVGKVAELEKKMSGGSGGTIGIAHTRWATHGKPSVANAHPHIDCGGTIALVHNGIIENYRSLKAALIKKGHRFRSETDSEVVAHLIEEEMKKKTFEESVVAALRKIRGTYGIVVLSQHEPDTLIAARNSSPLVLGVGNGEFIIASDASAIVDYTQRVVYLDDGEVAFVTAQDYAIRTIGDEARDKKVVTLEWTTEEAQKNGHAHFMRKEIFEQPEALINTFRGRLLVDEGRARLGGLRAVEDRLRATQRIVIVSCGTSFHAGLIGKYMIEEYAGVVVEVAHASEFRYRKPLLDAHTTVVAISQSGETADTLAAVREAKMKGALTIGIVNVVGSTIARETDAGVYNHVGPEIGVASTKAFASQVCVLALFALLLGRQRSLSLVMGKRIARELHGIPRLMQSTLKTAPLCKKIARRYRRYDNMFYLGRKYNYPIALEGALKIKEIADLHAEGYPAGEMKHGPIALIDPQFPCVVIVPQDSVYDKMISGIEELKARGAKVIAVATKGDRHIGKIADVVVFIPKTLEMLTPFLSVIPLQLLAYDVGVLRGHDVDKPRNLAKSVTVE